jgi:hypothetical protein
MASALVDPTYPRRRVTDFDPEDHDLLIELRTEMRGLNQRIDSKMGDFQAGLSALRTESAGAFTRFDERIGVIEDWKHRVEGGALVGRGMVWVGFAGGGFLVGLVTLAMRATGHL